MFSYPLFQFKIRAPNSETVYTYTYMLIVFLEFVTKASSAEVGLTMSLGKGVRV